MGSNLDITSKSTRGVAVSNIASIKRQVATYLDECMALDGVSGCAVVSRTGALIGQRMDRSLSALSFAAMGATILGSSEAAASMVHFSRPSSVFVEVDDGGILVLGAGNDALITVIINKSADIQSLKRELAVIADNIGEE
ncbi:roadblock/LC7 domain-containing protein [Methanogenium sp. S4BF]|uniref:roadblock/LC7 domain-containing protein n=1 Tax=Methanogenium sp. S4BF TaxID=1789226 RepID=UPI0024168623|nr:roadblock/LC7 domain-containing protein [Methanogenium sp. S4BF]WFN34812.1 roadblock/LC7 domain-containing protein [Methanogenium sp. S4BF]